MTAVRAQLLSCKSAFLNCLAVTGQAGSLTLQLLLRVLMRQPLGSAAVQPTKISQLQDAKRHLTKLFHIFAQS